jgi:hypothetical protein
MRSWSSQEGHLRSTEIQVVSVKNSRILGHTGGIRIADNDPEESPIQWFSNNSVYRSMG